MSAVVVVFNPKSGRGRGHLAAAGVTEFLRGRGHDVVSVSIGDGWGGLVVGARAVVAAGGDGTALAVAGALLDSGTPMYQCPLGTENLFAREFGMSSEPSEIARALERGRTRRVDVGTCNGRPFVLMCSVGFDANVIHRLDRVRRGPISHLSYAAPIVREILRPSIPVLRVTVDGRVAVDGVAGSMVVANSRQFACRIDPAPEARVDDGMLDMVFFGHRTSAGVLRHRARSRMRWRDMRSVVRARGRRVLIESIGSPAAYQLDGEASGRAAGPAMGSLAGGLSAHERTPLEIGVRGGALTVLAG